MSSDRHLHTVSDGTDNSGTQGQQRKPDQGLPVVLLDTGEVATLLRCGRTKAVELIRTGTIPSVLIAGLRRVRLDDFRAYIAGLPASLPGDSNRGAA